jgi:hypothetical protein
VAVSQGGKVDLEIESGRQLAFRSEEAEESPECGDIVLETSSAQPFACLGDVGFDIAGLDAPHGDACFLQVLEKRLRGSAVA